MTVVGRVVTAGIVAVGSIVLGGSAQAVAVTQADSAGQITSPADGQVVSGSSVTVSARTGLMQLRMGLYVEGPSTPTQKVAEGGANQTISGTFDAGNAPNGTFAVTLKGEITGTTYANSTFKVRRPPGTPGNVNATLRGTKKILVTWSKGSEPDLQSYEVSNTRSGIVGRLPVDSACNGSTCEAALAVPTKAAGLKVGFTVKAFRGDGDGGSVGSDESGAAYVTVPAPPAAQPKKETAKPRETPGSRGVDSLPTLPSKKQLTQPTSKPTTDKPTTSKLPAIPNTDADGNLPIPTADDQGENGGLTPEGTKNGTDTEPAPADGVKAQSNESPIGNIGQYGLYVAGGLLLLLLGAHAGAWARRRAIAGEGGRPRGATTAAAAHAAVVGGGPEGATSPVGAAGVVQGHDDGVPATGATPLRRRPAVILAVAKTRVPEQSRAGAGQSSAVGRSGVQEAPSDALPLSDDDVPALEGPALESKAGEAGGGSEGRTVRQEPIRIALPSSAVTDVPETSVPVPPPVVRIEERWDDYLPPSPRSMEDSGFWERPQPGAADFWAADDDDDDEGDADGRREDADDRRAYAGRRDKGGHG